MWAVLRPRWGRVDRCLGALATAGSALVILLVPSRRMATTLLLMALGLNGLLANAVQTPMFALAAHVYPTGVRLGRSPRRCDRQSGGSSARFAELPSLVRSRRSIGRPGRRTICAFAGLACAQPLPALGKTNPDTDKFGAGGGI